jgi:hypothetical protein
MEQLDAKMAEKKIKQLLDSIYKVVSDTNDGLTYYDGISNRFDIFREEKAKDLMEKVKEQDWENMSVTEKLSRIADRSKLNEDFLNMINKRMDSLV